MLLPVTSSLVWWARRPAIAEFMERSMGRAPQGWDGREGGGFRGNRRRDGRRGASARAGQRDLGEPAERDVDAVDDRTGLVAGDLHRADRAGDRGTVLRSEEHTSELQSRQYLVCRLLLEKKQ